MRKHVYRMSHSMHFTARVIRLDLSLFPIAQVEIFWGPAMSL